MNNQVELSSLVRGFGQSTLSLSFNLGGLLAGMLLATYFDVFSITSWALLIFPGILSIRGAIGGLFCGHLSTALHTGRVLVSFTKNTKHFHLLLYAIITLTLESGIILGVAASLFGVFFLGVSLLDLFSILAVTITTMGLSIAFMSPITMGVSVLSFKKGLDPDVIVYPLISTVADVLVTICYFFVLVSFFSSPQMQSLILFFDLIFIFIVCYLLKKNRHENVFVKTLKEFFLTLILVAFIVNITGSFLSKISVIIGDKPKMYMAYPALIDTIGDVGSIVGSTVTTKLALGLIKPSFSSIKQHLVVIGNAWSASLVMFILYATVASLMHGLPSSWDQIRFIARLLMTNILSVPLMIIVSFVIAIYVYKRGWDPDNFVIPIESTLADSVTTISLFVALILII